MAATSRSKKKVAGRLGRPVNTKLGPLIHSWSVPAEKTCPGATEACLSVCYALTGTFKFTEVQQRYEENLRFSETAGFEDWLTAALKAEFVRCLRLHVSGDLYDADYTAQLRRVMARSPQVVFYLYTRSWRDPEILPEIRQLARLRNVHVWLSADVDTGRPPRIKRTRIAWMARNDTEALACPRWAQLIFRNEVKTTLKKVRGVQVCPYEIGVPRKPKVTCSRCKICFTEPR